MSDGEKLLRPTVPLVKWYSARFRSAPFPRAANEGLRKLIDTFPGNVMLSDVLVKVAALNALYATNIYAIFPVAQHITDLHIDDRLKEGDLTLVTDIAQIEIAGKWRYNYSFASKYCAWHASEAYAVYDSYVDWLLWRYQVQEQFYRNGFRRYHLKNYPKFMSIILAFRDFFGLQGLTINEIDHFLWLYGNGVEPTSEDINDL